MLPKESYHLERDTWLGAVVVGGLFLAAGVSWAWALLNLIDFLKGV